MDVVSAVLVVMVVVVVVVVVLVVVVMVMAWGVTMYKSTCGNYDSDLQLSSHLCSQQLVNIPRVLIVHV